MISPILMKPLLEPIARESTTREEMYPCTDVVYWTDREEIVAVPADNVLVEIFTVIPVTVE